MTQWKLVPVEPTHNMILAGSLDSRMTPAMAEISYRAMLNSAPAPDVQPAIYPEEARQMGLEEVPYYTHPPVADVQELVEALKDLSGYADTCELFLKEANYVGKAQALRNRVSKAIEVLEKWEGK